MKAPSSFDFDWKYALSKFLKMATSRTFLVLLFTALAASKINIAGEWQAFIIAAAAGLYAILTQTQDNAEIASGMG